MQYKTQMIRFMDQIYLMDLSTCAEVLRHSAKIDQNPIFCSWSYIEVK